MSTLHRALLAASIAALAGCTTGMSRERAASAAGLQPRVESRAKAVLTVDGLRFRDADGDGKLSRFEDWRVPADERAKDLVGRMSAEEKVGTLFHSTLPGKGGDLGRAASYDFDELASLVNRKHVTSFITRLGNPPAELAELNNRAQQVAEAGRLGIPLTISTDPRNHFQYVLGAGESSAGTSQWPEPLGFAALRDPERMRRFAAIARKEYRAVGINMALSPQLDLTTEPRWSRATGTFGSDPALTSRLGAAYVAGFQGDDRGLTRGGVLTVIKHWVGYGAQPEGFDGHNYYGRFARPGKAFSQHVDAFRGALAVRAGGLMPAYPIIEDATVGGKPVERVGPGYSSVLLTDLLRGKLGYRGMILSDWGITRTCSERCKAPTAQDPQRPMDIAMDWGVEDLTVEQRYVKAVQAGVDQFGGTDDVAPLLSALSSGKISAARIDATVRAVLEPKFAMGLFEDPYVDPLAAANSVGTPDDRALAALTQREAQVLLKSDGSFAARPGAKVWLSGMDPAAARAAGLVVMSRLADADFAIVRAESPADALHPQHFFGSRQKEGRLDFRDGDPAFDALKAAAAANVPTAFAVFLDRPAILTSVQDKAAVILANFGASDAAVLDVLLGRARARGTLPFQLPRSMAQVEAQDPGAPDDIADPLYPRGAGIVARP